MTPRIISFCLLSMLYASFADNITLTSNGASDYVIIRPAKSSEAQIYAAQELQKYVKQISGCDLEIRTDETPLPPRAILLGETRFTAQLLGGQPDMKKLGPGGFRLCTKTPYIMIIGSRQRGTIYGVYELLEKYLGCRWYSSNFSIIPSKATIVIPAMDDVQVPAFAIREPFYYDVIMNPDFAVKMRANGHAMKLDAKHGGHIYYANKWLVHTFQQLVPAAKYYDTHPEYFMMKDGVRRKGQELCLSNPDVLKIVIDRVKNILKNDPEAQFISISQPDGASACECPKCKALDEREGSPSASIINFVNKVGEAIEREYPNVLVETLAYQYTRKPPKTLRPRKNVVPRLCSIECDFSQPLETGANAENIKFRSDLDKWSKISSRLLIWDYVTCFHPYIMPFPNFNSLQKNLQYFKAHNVYGVLSMGDYNGPHGEFAQLRTWVLAKLQWDPDQDVEKLYDDFFAGYYGSAGKYVREYFEGLQKLSGPDENELLFRTKITAPWFKRKFFIDARKMFDKAEQAVEDDPEKLQHVRTASIPVYYALIETWPEFRAKQVWENGESKMTGVPAGYAELAKEIFRRMEEIRMYRPDEYVHWSAKFRYDMRKYSGPAKPVQIGFDNTSVGVIPSLGAMLSSLKIDGINYIRPEYGGIDFAIDSRKFGNRWGSLAMMEGENAFCFELDAKHSDSKSATCYLEMPDVYRIERKISMLKNGIDINTRIKRHRPEPHDIAPQFRLAMDFGDVDSLCYKLDNGQWQNAGVPSNRIFSKVIIRGDSLKSSITVASAQTGRGIAIHFQRLNHIAYIEICPNLQTGVTQIIVAMVEKTLPSNCQNIWTEYKMRLMPYKNLSGLPSVEKIDKHTADIVVFDDNMLTVANPGWGNFVNDAKAEDGHSVRLNTYPAWAATWDIEPALFTPGCKYTAKILVRVDKSDNSGEAFYAGIYDTKTRKDVLHIARNISETKNEYQWYTLGEITPAVNQKFWIGPGRYDRKKGEHSAVKHVYVDKLVFTKVSESNQD